jgi:hypothetical protein
MSCLPSRHGKPAKGQKMDHASVSLYDTQRLYGGPSGCQISPSQTACTLALTRLGAGSARRD